MTDNDSSNTGVEALYHSYQKCRSKWHSKKMNIENINTDYNVSESLEFREYDQTTKDNSERLSMFYENYIKTRVRPPSHIYNEILQAAHNKIDIDQINTLSKDYSHKDISIKSNPVSGFYRIQRWFGSRFANNPKRFSSHVNYLLPVALVALLVITVVPISIHYSPIMTEESDIRIIALNTQKSLQSLPYVVAANHLPVLPNIYGFSESDSDIKKSFRLGAYTVDWYLAQRITDQSRAKSVANAMIMTISSWEEGENLQMMLRKMHSTTRLDYSDPKVIQTIFSEAEMLTEKYKSVWHFLLGQWVETLFYFSNINGVDRPDNIPEELVAPATIFYDKYSKDTSLPEPAQKLVMAIATQLNSEYNSLSIEQLHFNTQKLKLLMD